MTSSVSSSYAHSAGGVSSTPGGAKPPKYKDGSLNPDWVEWKKGINRAAGYNAPGTTIPNSKEAAPVICSMQEKFELEQGTGNKLAFTPQMEEALRELQNPNYGAAIGLDPDDVVDTLGNVLAKYEVPIGLMRKLLDVSRYDAIEFIIDDSGSMTNVTDSQDIHGNQLTRKEEALSRMLEMVEVLCYVNTPPIKVRFINYHNQKVCLELHRGGQSPENFYESAKSQIQNLWEKPDWRYRTPMRSTMQKSFDEGAGKKVIRYVFGDGVPTDHGNPIRDIENMVIRRSNPKDNPVTFMSCTGEDEEVEWMKVLEEKAPYASESDDYRDELDEVRGDQGEAFPYTKGLYIVCELVAAMNPDDLDLLDECIPFSKHDYDLIQGYISDGKDYQNYFNGFVAAQKKRKKLKNKSKEDKVKNSMKWDKLYNELVRVTHASEIKAVREYQHKLSNV